MKRLVLRYLNRLAQNLYYFIDEIIPIVVIILPVLIAFFIYILIIRG